MDRLISEQAEPTDILNEIQKEIKNIVNKPFYYPCDTISVGVVLKIIDKYKAIPSADKWIPVSERLPEDRREVLVTAYWHETYQVMMASYFGDGLWWCVPFNNCGEHMQKLKPKAWMPLPTPYEPQERSE